MENIQPANVNNNEVLMSIMSQHPILKKDPYTQRVLETGVADNGEEIGNMEDFLIMRGVILEEDEAKRKVEEIKNKNPDVFVLASVRPDKEKNVIN